MGQVLVCINAYDDAPLLTRAIQSARTAAPHARIVVVDGAYADFPHEAGKPESTDGTIDIALQSADTLIRCPGADDGRPKAWADEVEKRNAYLIGGDGDWYLVLDADERLEGKVPPASELFAPDQDIEIVAGDGASFLPFKVFRLFAHREGLRYEGAHHALWAGGMLLNSDPRQMMDGCRIVHDQHMRPGTRTARKSAYYHLLTQREAEFRRTHVLV